MFAGKVSLGVLKEEGHGHTAELVASTEAVGKVC
jgi:hypothetical protein